MNTLTSRWLPLMVALPFVIASCGPGVPSKEDGAAGDGAEQVVDETADEVLTVVNSLFQAMQARDSTRIRMTLHPDAVFTSVNLTGDEATIGRVEGDAFAS